MTTLYAETIEKLFDEFLNSRSSKVKDFLELELEKVEAKAKASALKKYRWEVYGPSTQDKRDTYIDEKITKFKKNILEVVDFKSVNDVRKTSTVGNTYFAYYDEDNNLHTVSKRNWDVNEFFRAVSHEIAFGDCNCTSVDIICLNGRKVEYVGWQPNMLFTYKINGMVFWEASFPEWDH